MAQTDSNVHKNATQGGTLAYRWQCFLSPLPEGEGATQAYFTGAIGLLDLKEGAQPAVECRGSAGNQCGLKDFKQFLLGCAEAYGPLHVSDQALAVRTSERQEGNGHEGKAGPSEDVAKR